MKIYSKNQHPLSQKSSFPNFSEWHSAPLSFMLSVDISVTNVKKQTVLPFLPSKTASASVRSAWTPALVSGSGVPPVCPPGSPEYPQCSPSAVPPAPSRCRRSCCRSRPSAPAPGKSLCGMPAPRLRRPSSSQPVSSIISRQAASEAVSPWLDQSCWQFIQIIVHGVTVLPHQYQMSVRPPLPHRPPYLRGAGYESYV